MRLDISTFATLDDAKLWAFTAIDAAAGKARARYITTVPGQSETYTAKYQNALAYVAAGYPEDLTPYPWIAQEATDSGLSTAMTADIIKLNGDQWANVLGPAIEGKRTGGKRAVLAIAESGTAIGEVLTAARATIAALDAI